MSRQANGRIRIGNQGACSLTACFRPQCPRTIRQNPKNRKSPPATIQQIRLDGRFFDRNFLLKRFRKHEKRFRKKSRKPLKTQE